MNDTGTENLTSNNLTINETLVQPEQIFNITIYSQIINVIITFFTVILNSFMIKCLQISRSNISRVIYGQLMSLCVSDLIAGFTPAASCLTLIQTLNRRSKTCAVLVATYHTAQYAVLLNLCALSIRRWLVLRKATTPSGNEENLSVSIFITLCAWLVSLTFCFARTFVTLTDNLTINGCLSPDLFTNAGAVNSIIVTYTGSVILLNVFYIFSAVIIKRMDNPNSSGTSNLRQRIQKRAFKNLLAVLMVTNVTTVPTVVLPITFGFFGLNTPDVRYNLTHIQALNSMLNPLLYTANIKEIRTAVNSRLCFCWRSNSDVPSSTTTTEEQPATRLTVSTTLASADGPLNQNN